MLSAVAESSFWYSVGWRWLFSEQAGLTVDQIVDGKPSPGANSKVLGGLIYQFAVTSAILKA